MIREWNKRRFSIYTSDEKSVLGLIDEMGKQVNYNTDNIEESKVNINKKVSYEDMETKYNFKEVNGEQDYQGSWHGVKFPTMSEEGLRGQVEKNMADIVRLNLLTSNSINVKDLGAKGDGVTDDTQAFLKAIEKLQGVKGVLFIPTGKYLLKQKLVFRNGDITILGQGVNLTHLYFDKCEAIDYSSTNLFTDNFSMEGLTIVTNSNDKIGVSVVFPSNMGSTWENCNIKDVVISGSTTLSEYDTNSNNQLSTINGFTKGIYLNNCGLTKLKNITVRNGVGLELDGYTVDIHCENLAFYGCTTGINKKGKGEGLRIDHCLFIHVDYGVRCNHENSGDGVWTSITNCHLAYKNVGIIIENQPQSFVDKCLLYNMGTLTNWDIIVKNSSSTKITNNATILKPSSLPPNNGISIDNSPNCIVTGNSIQDRYTPLLVKANSTGIIVDSNIIGSDLGINDETYTIINTNDKIRKTFTQNITSATGTITVDVTPNKLTNKPVACFISGVDNLAINVTYNFDLSTKTSLVFNYSGASTGLRRFSLLVN